MGLSLTKESLIYTAFTIDALNTLFTFPLFAWKGPRWTLENITLKEDEVDTVTEVTRPAFRQLWELFMVCYEGYFGFTVSTLVCIYRLPESIPIYAYSLFGLYAYKLYALQKGSGLGTHGSTNDAQYKGKLNWIHFFFLPCYGGYCALHLFETMKMNGFISYK